MLGCTSTGPDPLFAERTSEIVLCNVRKGGQMGRRQGRWNRGGGLVICKGACRSCTGGSKGKNEEKGGLSRGRPASSSSLALTRSSASPRSVRPDESSVRRAEGRCGGTETHSRFTVVCVKQARESAQTGTPGESRVTNPPRPCQRPSCASLIAAPPPSSPPRAPRSPSSS